ncbi:DUF2530 domain-containing protein [Pseudonocardia sediminis]|uniref:DUF2530 domain-containing protein n=1 Tax=Pseudonocardia sediminis TaxID=1397368 RepID=UPI001029782B|nr:DUF2530 domain-containing protein [Pseudonocardia sediminis]
MTDPPSLPPRWTSSPPVIGTGTALWALGAVVALVVSLTAGAPLGEVFWTCVAGVGVGLFGVSVFTWQRAAARRGSRTAQTGVEGGRAD